jgi:putative glycosyl hydrolase
LSRVTPPSIEYLKMGNTGPKGKEIRVNNLYMDEATQTLDRTLMQKMQTTSPIPYPC